MAIGNEKAAPARTRNGFNSDLLGSKLDQHANTAARDGQDLIFLQDSLVGAVRLRGHGYEAVTAAGLQLGLFNTLTAAARAVIATVRP